MKKGTIIYHGTTDEFYPSFKTGVMMFFTKSLQYALNHTEVHNGDEEGERFVIAEFEVKRDLNLFDPRLYNHKAFLSELPENIEHKKANELISKRKLFEKLDLFNNDVWRYLEIETVQKLIENLGFDGHIAKESDELTYCIYKPYKCVKNKALWCPLNTREYEYLFDH